MTPQRVRIIGAVSLSAATAAIDGVLYVGAVGSLISHGPNATGYGWLAAANHTALVVAVLLASTGILLAVQGRGRRLTAAMVAATAMTLAVSVGLRVLGRELAAMVPAPQSPNLNSLLLAMIGTGADLMLVPVVFAAGAVTAFLISRVRVRARRSELAVVRPA